MKKKIFAKIGWCIAGMFVLLGVFLEYALMGYDFSAFLCFVCAAIIICFLLLRRLHGSHPKAARIMLTVLSICLCIGIIAAIITGILIACAAGGQSVPGDYVVVLGAGVNGTVPSRSLQDRLDAAYDYMIAHPNAICVVSGGQGEGEDITEASCMYGVLTARGIDGDRIWMEDKATNTRENIRFSLDLIESKTGVRPTEIGLVSSEYHLYRAGLFAREENVTAYGIPARTSIFTLRINYYLREIAAVWYYTILGG